MLPRCRQGLKKGPKWGPKVTGTGPFWRSLFEPASKRPPGTPQGISRDPPGTLQGVPRVPKWILLSSNSTMFDATSRQKIGESPVLYPRWFQAEFQTLCPQRDRPAQKAPGKNGESPVLHPRWFQAEFQTLWPQSDRPDQKAPAKKWRESRPVSQVFEGRVSNALAAE